jgi:sugar/nucleoside kinase (ribokinase family)
MSLVVVGSVAFDDVETRFGRKEKVLGGSASYFSVAASNFTNVKIVAVVGDDFSSEYMDVFKEKDIDISGLTKVEGKKSFFWRGKYADDFSTRTTLDTQLNVFAEFDPVLPESYKNADFLFLANIHPSLQLKVLDSMESKPFVAGDTMNLWIDTKLPKLKKVISRLNLLTINDEETRQLTGEFNLIKAGRAVQKMGPEYLILKKGEHGALLFLKDRLFYTPAYPLTGFKDPTGAGDTFGGGFMGHLAKVGKVDDKTLMECMFYGTSAASYTVEDYSLDKLKTINMDDLEKRFQDMVKYTTI